MKFLHYGTRMLQNSPPMGLLLGGTVLLIGLPLIRKGFRCAAMLAGKAIYSVTDEARNMRNHTPHLEEVHS